ncbi:conserved Plasmodium protein, unknown function [Plasmodium ovale curtisi]|uniref:Uncharacterized protein n=1 Tax=Plasmodium ovale curtisi TaxID=864141 RepID=A0A1A8X0X0_PLAOA|nr:conserved Plasmodium protein, unknown function [Plasmodium ovale curtisi]
MLDINPTNGKGLGDVRRYDNAPFLFFFNGKTTNVRGAEIEDTKIEKKKEDEQKGEKTNNLVKEDMDKYTSPPPPPVMELNNKVTYFFSWEPINRKRKKERKVERGRKETIQRGDLPRSGFTSSPVRNSYDKLTKNVGKRTKRVYIYTSSRIRTTSDMSLGVCNLGCGKRDMFPHMRRLHYDTWSKEAPKFCHPSSRIRGYLRRGNMLASAVNLLRNCFLFLFLIHALTKIYMVTMSMKMNSLHMKLHDRLLNSRNKITHFNSFNPKRKNMNTFIRYPYLHINQKNINCLKNKSTSSIYSQYYNNEPVYNTYNPILNYDILDLIKVYGRLAEHSEHESLNIVITLGKGQIMGEEAAIEEAKYNGTVGEKAVNAADTADVTSTTPEAITKGVNEKPSSGLFRRALLLFKGEVPSYYMKACWFYHFLKYGKMNFKDFKNSLLLLKFKWPKDSIFPSYNIFLFEKGLSKHMDSPLIRKRVEKYMQYQEINENLLKSCFYCFSGGKEYVTAYDILNTFIQWKINDKHKKKQENTSIFAFFKKRNNMDNTIDWVTFKNKIDAYTVQMHEMK